jgi:hypothetical protein
MVVVERLLRRNQDYLLIDTIKRVGVSNYSLLARLTGLNPETIRYKVNRHLGKMGLGVFVNVNFADLGLSISLLTLKVSPAKVTALFTALGYLVYMGKEMGVGRYVGLVAVPFKFKSKYTEMLTDSVTKGSLVEFDQTELYWVRYPPFRAEFYDFDQHCWKVDWTRVIMAQSELGASFLIMNKDTKVDFIDLKIIRALQQNPMASLAKMAREISANPRTVRYHNMEHVQKARFIISNNMRWVRPITEGKPNELMQAMISFRGLKPEDLVKVRRLFNNIPFTWLECGTEARDYFAFLDIPTTYFPETIKRIELHLSHIDNLEISILEPGRNEVLLVPDEMFDPERGWRLFGYKEDFAKEKGTGA